MVATRRLRSAGGDGLVQGEDTLGVAYVEVLDHPAVHRDDATTVGLGLLVGRDDLAGVLDVALARRERLVRGADLAWMDERLAVEAHLASLSCLGGEAFLVLHVVV